MSVQYLLVTFPEQRSVLADGNGVGFTNHILMLPSDEYAISLDGTGYAPASIDIALSGTSMVKPMVIGFSSGSTSTSTPATPATTAAVPKSMPAPIAQGAPSTAAPSGKASPPPASKSSRPKAGAKPKTRTAVKKDA
jgi:hypothetical protein